MFTCKSPGGGAATAEWRPLKLLAGPRGYHTVTLYTRGRSRTVPVRTLVARAFLGEPPRGTQLYCLGGPGRHSAADLAYLARGEAIARGLVPKPTLSARRGDANHMVKLTAETVTSIRRDVVLHGAGIAATALKHGTSRENALAIVKRRSWAWLPDGIPAYAPRPQPKRPGGLPPAAIADIGRHAVAGRLPYRIWRDHYRGRASKSYVRKLANAARRAAGLPPFPSKRRAPCPPPLDTSA